MRLLPRLLRYADLPVPYAGEPTGIPVGINETQLAPVYLDFGSEPHFLVFGDTEAGKSNVLRVLARQIVTRYTPDEARIIFADYRRSLLGSVETDHVIGYAASSAQLTELVAAVKASMDARLPGPNVTAEELRTRSWWSGPDLYLLVDDYEAATRPDDNLLRRLLPSAASVTVAANPDGDKLYFTEAEWDAFVLGVKDGEFDLDESGNLP